MVTTLPDNVSPSAYLPVDRYPWPNLVNPHIEQMGRDMERWIDADYTELTEAARAKYKRMRLHACTARMLPHMSYERIVPCNRYMLLYVEVDDQLEDASFDQVARTRDRIMAVLREDRPAAEYRHGVDRQAAAIRDEYRAYMPAEWVQRFIAEWEYSFTYGVGVETPYKRARRPPPPAVYVPLREHSVLMHPYLCWADIEANFVLPGHLYQHPVIKRLRSLAVQVIFVQNDIHSLPKEVAKDSEVFNLIRVLRYHNGLSIEAALEQAVRTHDTYLAEFQELHSSLPDLGEHQEQVYQYFHCIGTMIQGVNTFYNVDTARYLRDGAGFAWPGTG